MENNYYTPTIDEFCLGFEFEYFVRNFNEDNEYVDSEWVPSKVILSESNKAGTTHLDLQDIKLSYYQLGLALANKTIRVKTLDKEDLEELGFVHQVSLNSYLKPNPNHDNVFIEILIRNDITQIDPIGASTAEVDILYRTPYFYGNVKNKTELKKLLKQLNIEFNDN